MHLEQGPNASGEPSFGEEVFSSAESVDHVQRALEGRDAPLPWDRALRLH